MIDEMEFRRQTLTFVIPAREHAPVTAVDRQHPDLWWVECSGCPWLGRSSWSEVDALAKFRQHKQDASTEAIRSTVGAGKMDAAKALDACNGDVAAAIAWIEERKRIR